MKFLAAFVLLALSLTAGAGRTISLGDENFHLAESKKGDEASLEEYLPKGQTFTDYRKMVAVRRFPRIDSPKDYIGRMVADYRSKYPEMKFEAGSGPDGLYYLDCLMYPLGGEAKFVEWNYFVARPAGDGIIVYQYVERAPYQKQVKEGFEALNPRALRTRMLPILQKSIFVGSSGKSGAKAKEGEITR